MTAPATKRPVLKDGFVLGTFYRKGDTTPPLTDKQARDFLRDGTLGPLPSSKSAKAAKAPAAPSAGKS